MLEKDYCRNSAQDEDTTVRVLDIRLGINPSEPHGHGFDHHLACKSACSAAFTL